MRLRRNSLGHFVKRRRNGRSSTSTEVRSPTSTSTEVRSPTSTSTDAYTAGNVTVTGGAGRGATNVRISGRPSRGSRVDGPQYLARSRGAAGRMRQMMIATGAPRAPRPRKNGGPKGKAKSAAMVGALNRRLRVGKRRGAYGHGAERLGVALYRRRRTGNPRIKRRLARLVLRGVALRAARRRRNPIPAAALAGLNSVNPRNPKKKGTPMARRRRSAAQRAAFRKMIAGLKRHRGGKSRRRRNPRKRGGSHMARRRTHRSRRRAAVIMVNPRRRRRASSRRRHPGFRRRRHARRRNPGMGGGIKGALRSVFMAGIPAVGGGFVANFIDAKFLSTQNVVVRVLAKVAQAAAAALLFRNKPAMAYSAMGGVLGSIGGDFGTQMAGGVVVGSAPQAKAAGVAALITEDPRTMGVLVEGMRGMGYQIDSNVSLGDAPALPTGSYQDVNLG